jgi:hypothetical protein
MKEDMANVTSIYSVYIMSSLEEVVDPSGWINDESANLNYSALIALPYGF